MSATKQGDVTVPLIHRGLCLHGDQPRRCGIQTKTKRLACHPWLSPAGPRALSTTQRQACPVLTGPTAPTGLCPRIKVHLEGGSALWPRLLQTPATQTAGAGPQPPAGGAAEPPAKGRLQTWEVSNVLQCVGRELWFSGRDAQGCSSERRSPVSCVRGGPLTWPEATCLNCPPR